MKNIKIAFIGSGSGFCPVTINDILLDEHLKNVKIDLYLMDILEEAVNYSVTYAKAVISREGRDISITGSTDLEKAVDGADFVITAIEVDRYYYWTMDYHIPRRYGSAQVYGENGGPGGMFHFLRNIEPMIEIARAMERLCPDAWLLNYTNPEAKLVDAIGRYTKIKSVGLCHGIGEGQHMLSKLLEMPEEDLDVVACGLNHFGWYQSIKNKKTGEDLYPLLKEKERKANWMTDWDGYALSRILLRTYGLLPYPVTNHIAEYIRWADGFIASPNMQFFYDPASEDPWTSGDIPPLVYFATDFINKTYFLKEGVTEEDMMTERFRVPDKLEFSGELGVPIISSMTFDIKTPLLSVNLINNGSIPGLPDDMAVELPASVDANGIIPCKMDSLPDSITEMIRIQGIIHKLIMEAYTEKSRNKLLQAILLDPTVSSYNSSVAMINEMCEKQKEILPEMRW